MLDLILDYFIIYLTQGIIPDKSLPSADGSTPHRDETSISYLVKKKRDMIEIMTELL